MNYFENTKKIQLGDKVLLDYDVVGIVVCDFDEHVSLEGFESWLIDDELVGGGYLDNGIMVKTESMGFVHCIKGNVIVTPANDSQL